MMAPKPVAAKEGAMKDIAEYIGLFMRLSSKCCRLFFDWMLDWGFKRLDPGSSHPTKPLYAL